MSVSQDRIQKERERAGLSVVFGQSTQELAPRRQRTRTPGVGLAPRPSPSGRAEALAKSIPQLLPPPPSAEALSSPARRRAEAEGYANFGKRTWFLVSREESFRAVESLDDAPGWSLVTEMKR